MLALFGKKANTKKGVTPWDEVRYGCVSFPLYRTKTHDGRTRIQFGFSRPYERGQVTQFARTFDIQHLWDVLHGISKLALNLANRDIISQKDRETLLRVYAALRRALNAEASNGVDASNE